MHSPLDLVGFKIYREIAENFPISSASDEFFYFPQATNSDPDWSVWDRFSPEVITELAGKLSGWENEIDNILSKAQPQEKTTAKNPFALVRCQRLDDRDQQKQRIIGSTLSAHERQKTFCRSAQDDADPAELRLLKKVVRTLREHLVYIRVWETQPSLYLTITCLGLAESLEQGLRQAGQRALTLPQFLDQAGWNLKNVPAFFRDVGLEMIKDTRAYLTMLQEQLPHLAAALDALDRFEDKLKTVSLHSGFRLPEEQLSLVIEKHINCGMSIAQTAEALDGEIEDVNRTLAQEARTMGFKTWPEAYASISLPDLGHDGLVGLYRDEVLRLGRHCRQIGLVSDRLNQANPVKVMPVPEYLSAIRAASSYSIGPGHPPAGGVFYVLKADDPAKSQKESLREFRILAAHETWPGHHLLDINRWSLGSPVLRAVEQPLFYEGWACFAEEMLGMTGYTTAPGDRLMVAKRRLWRAIRGKVDLGLQTGTMSMEKAVFMLTRTGMNPEQARSSARKYVLNPGYQLCYTLGLRYFMNLYELYGCTDITWFARIVLNHGQICFQDLERILQIKNTSSLQ